MDRNRPYYRTMASWAAAKATELRHQADAMSSPVPGNGWRRARAREQSAIELRRQAAKFDRIAKSCA